MLVLSRKKGESIILQDNIEITVLEVEGETVKIGIAAPKDVEILRKELYSMVKETNREASAPLSNLRALHAQLKKFKKNNGKL